mmetsp:Transcript_31463/g.67056  ORF Transcript_31463/g.67056 Transcript_31463/m.67056 type:complete len:159 (-) Transcript_31463:336-812(-)
MLGKIGDGGGVGGRQHSNATARLLLLLGVMSLPAVAAFRRSVGFGVGRRSLAAFAPPPRSRGGARPGAPSGVARLSPRGLAFPPSAVLRSSVAGADTEAPPVAASDSDGFDSQYDVTNAQTGLAGTSYEPKTFESEVYQWWEKSGCFLPDAKQPAAAL